MATTQPDPKPLRPPRAQLARVRRYINERALLRPGDRVLVAVSGGPDSTCLLLTLAALRRSLGIAVEAAHFDHGLRGKLAAEREQRFVRQLCEQLDVPLRWGRGDVRARAKKRSLEDAARELRYRFLAKAAASAGCTAIATGHTRDDQAETVLLHLLRGSGLRGLAAMAPSAAMPVRSNARLVRPLLALSHDETVRCCHDAGLRPIEDPSNRSAAHTRNRVRHKLLPQLRRFNPRIEEALCRLAEAAADDIELLETLAGEVLPSPAADGSLRIPRRRLAALPEALRRHAVRLAVARVLGDGQGLSERHLLAIARAAEGATGKQLDLPRGLRAEVARDAVVLSRTTRSTRRRALPARAATLALPGIVSFGPWRVEAELIARQPRTPSRSTDGLVVCLDADTCHGPLSVRRRRPGDRFHPLGLAAAKKLQDFFVDAHVPRADRDAVPLVCANGHIAWVAGQRPAEWAKITPATRRVVRLRASRNDA